MECISNIFRSAVLLHRQHADLSNSVAREIVSCTPNSNNDMPSDTPGTYIYNLHTAKVITATENLTSLVTLPAPMIQHTPFFTCACTLASIIHLSHWSFLTPLTPDGDVKQQLRLNVGALKKMSEVWPNAVNSLKQVQGVAQEMLSEKKRLAEFWSTIIEKDLQMPSWYAVNIATAGTGLFDFKRVAWFQTLLNSKGWTCLV